MHWLDFVEKGKEELRELIDAKSMFEEKKLVVLESIFDKGIEEQRILSDYLKQIKAEKKEELILIIREKKAPDKRTELFKFLTKKPAMSQEFKNLDGIKLENWIKKEVEKKGGKIETRAANALAAFAGNNLWQMANEVDKLVSFKGGGAIEESDIKNLVAAKIDNNIFETVDALAEQNKKKALRLLHNHIEKGESEIYLFVMFIRQFRNLLIIKEATEKGSSYYELAKRTGLHPFVVRKTSGQAKEFTLEGLKKIYEKLLDFDIGIKTGKVSAQAALDMLAIGL